MKFPESEIWKNIKGTDLKERNQHLLSIYYELGPKHVGTQMLFHLIHITSSSLPLLPPPQKKKELEEMTYTDPSSSNTL